MKNIEIECLHTSDDVLRYEMTNGDVVTIKRNAVDIYQQLQNLPADYRLALMCVTEDEIITYLNNTKAKKYAQLKEILTTKWQWQLTGERYAFDDVEANFELLGVEKTKRQLMDKIRRRTFKVSEITAILNRFDEQTELIEVD